jgi:hypothetical protein
MKLETPLVFFVSFCAFLWQFRSLLDLEALEVGLQSPSMLDQ